MTTTTNQAKTRRHFDDAFKRDAVNRVIRTNKSCAEVSRELGIRGNLLARWKREQLERADQAATGSEQMKPSELAPRPRPAVALSTYPSASCSPAEPACVSVDTQSIQQADIENNNKKEYLTNR